MQKIVCKNGRCIEKNSLKAKLNYLYDNKNIVDQIEHDIMKQYYE